MNRIPWGSSTRSKSYKRFPGNWPRTVSWAKGCHIYAEKKVYVDFISALGPIILGYWDLDVNDAVQGYTNYGNLFSLPHKLENEVAELLCEVIPSAERVLFLKNGGDVTAAAIRLARGITGKSIVLNKGYHGWYSFDQTQEFSFPLLETVYDIAGVIVEPELFRYMELSRIREICDERGIILIFDEVISGFRIAMGGVQEFYGIIPDLSCFSKAMANGYPISALVGKAEFMDRLEQDVFVSTTFGGDCIGLAACKATIEKMRREGVIDHIWRIGGYLEEGLEEIIKKYDFPMKLYGFPPMIHFKMPDDIHKLFLQEIIKEGIMIYNSYNLNYSHKEEHIDKLLEAYNEVFPAILDGRVKYEGDSIDRQTFREFGD